MGSNRSKSFLIGLTVLLLLTSLSALSLHAAWMRTFGTPSADEGGVYAIGEEGFLVWTRAGDGGMDELSLSRLDPSGAPLWTKKITAAGQDDLAVQMGTGGQPFIAGTTGGSLAWAPLTADGGPLPATAIPVLNPSAATFLPTDDGGLLATALVVPDRGTTGLLALKVSATGDIEWSKIIGMVSPVSPPTAGQVSGGYYVTVPTVEGTILIKLTSSGHLLWARAYDTTGADLRAASGFGDGGVVLADSRNGTGNALLVAVGEAGEVVFAQEYAVPGARLAFEAAYGTGNALIVAGSLSDGTGTRVAVLNVSMTGSVLWAKEIAANDSLKARLVSPAAGRFFLTGTIGPEAFLALLAPSMEPVWAKSFGQALEGSVAANPFDLGYLLAASTPATEETGTGLMVATIRRDGTIPGCAACRDLQLTTNPLSATSAGAAGKLRPVTLAAADAPQALPFAFAARDAVIAGKEVCGAAQLAAEDPPQIYIPVSTIDFGEEFVGDISDWYSVEVSNIGGGTLWITAMNVVNPPFFLHSRRTCEGKKLRAGRSCTMDFQFRPTVAGEASKIVMIYYVDIDHPSEESFTYFDLKGKGITPVCEWALGENESTTIKFGARKGKRSVKMRVMPYVCHGPGTTPYDCPWLSIAMSGNWHAEGKVTFAVQQNNETSKPRTCMTSIGDITFTITQDGAKCTGGVTPRSHNTCRMGKYLSSDLTVVPGDCPWWTEVIHPNNAPTGWLAVAPPDKGEGARRIWFSLTNNSTGKTRSGSVIVNLGHKPSAPDKKLSIRVTQQK